MKEKVSPGIIVVAALVLVAIIGALYWRTLGSGSANSEEAKWSKPPVMKGPLQMPNIPPPPSGPTVR